MRFEPRDPAAPWPGYAWAPLLHVPSGTVHWAWLCIRRSLLGSLAPLACHGELTDDSSYEDYVRVVDPPTCDACRRVRSMAPGSVPGEDPLDPGCPDPEVVDLFAQQEPSSDESLESAPEPPDPHAICDDTIRFLLEGIEESLGAVTPRYQALRRGDFIPEGLFLGIAGDLQRPTVLVLKDPDSLATIPSTLLQEDPSRPPWAAP